MKQLIRLVILTLVLPLATSASAQVSATLPGVAFVKADRTALFLKQQDSTVKTVLQSTPPFFVISKLALLGETPGGKNFLLAGTFQYNTTVFNGIINVPSNLDLSNPATVLQQIKFLFAAPNGATAFRPIGGVTSDGNHWFVCFVSQSPGNVPPVFYHGSMNADISTNPQIDSATLPPANAVSVFHMTNMAISPDNNTIVVVIADHLDAEPSLRFQRVRWAPSGPFQGINVTEFHSNVGSLNQNVLSKDSMFGFGLRMLPSNNQAELLLANVGTTDNSLQAFLFSWSANNVDLTHQTWSIPRSAIPADMNFFAGFNGAGTYTEDNQYSQQHGNAGDISFSSSGDSAVFITHEAPDNINNRKAKSAIFIYDIASQTATQLYNDQNALELQPIFVDVPYIIPPTPGEIALSNSTLDYGTIDTGKTSQMTIDVTDTSGSNSLQLVVDSVTVTGANAGDFVIAGPATPYTLASGAKQTYSITFSAHAPAGLHTAVFNVYYNHGVAGSPRTSMLKATVHVPPLKNVKEDPALAANVTMSPNPFETATQVRLTAPNAGTLGIAVRDALGRLVYTSDLRKVTAGSTESFDFDAKSLGLSSGTYYVSALFGDRQITRQIVFTK